MKKLNISKIIACILIVPFIYIMCKVIGGNSLKIDLVVTNFFVESLRNKYLTPLVIGITYCGSAYMYALLLIIFFIVFKNKKIPLSMAICLSGSVGIMQILKHIVLRPRPNVLHLVSETGYSFPSGHSLNAIVFYGLCIYFIYKYAKNRKNLWISLIILLIIMIGISRIYLGVHYITDIFGGFLIGIIYLIFYINVINPFIMGKEKKNEKKRT